MSKFIKDAWNYVTTPSKDETKPTNDDTKDDEEVVINVELFAEKKGLIDEYAKIVDPDKNRLDLITKMKAIGNPEYNGKSYNYKTVYASSEKLMPDLFNESKFTRRQAISILKEILTDDSFKSVRSYIWEKMIGESPRIGVTRLGWNPPNFSSANHDQMLKLYCDLYKKTHPQLIDNAMILTVDRLKQEYDGEEKLLAEIKRRKNAEKIEASAGKLDKKVVASQSRDLEDLRNNLTVKSGLDAKISRANKITKLFQNPSNINAQFSSALNELNNKLTLQSKIAYYMNLFKVFNGLDLDIKKFTDVKGILLYEGQTMSSLIDDGAIVKNLDVDQDKVKQILREQQKNKLDSEMKLLYYQYYDV